MTNQTLIYSEFPHYFQTIILHGPENIDHKKSSFIHFFLPCASRLLAKCMPSTYACTHARTYCLYACTYTIVIMFARSCRCYLFKHAKKTVIINACIFFRIIFHVVSINGRWSRRQRWSRVRIVRIFFLDIRLLINNVRNISERGLEMLKHLTIKATIVRIYD